MPANEQGQHFGTMEAPHREQESKGGRPEQCKPLRPLPPQQCGGKPPSPGAPKAGGLTMLMSVEDSILILTDCVEKWRFFLERREKPQVDLLSCSRDHSDPKPSRAAGSQWSGLNGKGGELGVSGSHSAQG